MELDQNTFELIENYLLDKLPLSEKEAFIKELNKDKKLKEEVELQRFLLEGLNRSLLRDQIAMIYADSQQEKQEPKIIRIDKKYYAIAAVMLVLVASVVLLLLNRDSPTERLFAELHDEADKDPGIGTTLAPGIKEDFDAAMHAYRTGEYKRAIQLLQSLKEQAPENETIAYYLGLCYLEIGKEKAALAIPLLEKVKASENTALRSQTEWYLALAYLRAEQLDKAKQAFEEIANSPKHFWQAKSEKALEELK